MKDYELVSVFSIRPLEQVFPHHLRNLREMIEKDGVLKYALEVDRQHRIVLDGSHRLAWALIDGYSLIPVHWVDYDDPNIRVGTHLIHRLLVDGPINISKEEVIRRGLTGDLFPPRTTRHFFPFIKKRIRNPLTDLVPGLCRPEYRVLIKEATLDEEIQHNLKYIQEIDEEQEKIRCYLEEGMKTKEYLQKQIVRMRNTDWNMRNTE